MLVMSVPRHRASSTGAQIVLIASSKIFPTFKKKMFAQPPAALRRSAYVSPSHHETVKSGMGFCIRAVRVTGSTGGAEPQSNIQVGNSEQVGRLAMHTTASGLTIAYCAIMQVLIDTLMKRNILSVEEVRTVLGSAAQTLAPDIKRPSVREALDIIHAMLKALNPEEVR
jgi:hypothetical protein